MTDHIEIRALRVLCHVGVGDDERASAQPLELDLDLEADLGDAASSDDVADTIDYGAVSLAVAAAVQASEHALLERVAVVAADAALAVDVRSSAVTVCVRKLRPPIPLDVGSTAVRMRRTRA
jgi:7,8-dihydroneopterin aldolase/epimerase/oxygenase